MGRRKNEEGTWGNKTISKPVHPTTFKTACTTGWKQYDANAIIGIVFDYITFSNNMIGVIANGTAVVVENQNDY